MQEDWKQNPGTQPVASSVLVDVLFTDESKWFGAVAGDLLWSLSDDYPIAQWRLAAPPPQD